MFGNAKNFGKTKVMIVLTGAGLALAGAGAGVATAEPNTPAPPPAPTTTSPQLPGKPGTVHPNVSAGDCESGGGIAVLNPDGTRTCIGGFYNGLQIF